MLLSTFTDDRYHKLVQILRHKQTAVFPDPVPRRSKGSPDLLFRARNDRWVREVLMQMHGI